MANRSIAIGGIEIVALVDAVPAPVSPDWPFPDVPPAAWDGLDDGSLNADGLFHPNLGCFLVHMPGRTVLLDAGIGPGPSTYLKGIRGSLPDRLAEAGSGFDAIDAVVFTHLHMDHVGWAARRDEDGQTRPTIAAAPHFVASAELEYWLGEPRDAGGHHRRAFDACVRPLVRDGLIEAVGGDEEFLADLSFLPLPGHTPGHCAVLVSAGSEPAIIAGDVLHCPAQVANPAWCHRADRDPSAARRSRRRLLDLAAADRMIVCAGHCRDPVVFGRIEAFGEGYRHRPLGGLVTAAPVG